MKGSAELLKANKTPEFRVESFLWLKWTKCTFLMYQAWIHLSAAGVSPGAIQFLSLTKPPPVPIAKESTELLFTHFSLLRLRIFSCLCPQTRFKPPTRPLRCRCLTYRDQYFKTFVINIDSNHKHPKVWINSLVGNMVRFLKI